MAIKVTLLAHTPNPEQTVAMAAKLCYSPSGIEDIRDGLDEKKRLILSICCQIWVTQARPSTLPLPSESRESQELVHISLCAIGLLLTVSSRRDMLTAQGLTL